MGEDTKIEWCDASINFWWGCTKVSPGCANCYAAAWSNRLGKKLWGNGVPREEHLASARKLALKLNRKAEKMGKRLRVFANSMSDWLDEEVPLDWLWDLIGVIRDTPNLDWLLLTKRPENFLPRMKVVCNRGSDLHDDFIYDWLRGNPPTNVWVGTTVENQEQAEKRIPWLLKIPAKVRFLSCEPLLGPVDLKLGHGWCNMCVTHNCELHGRPVGAICTQSIHWVICGGESGPKARPMHPDWARNLRDQCKEAAVPFFFKQWGEWMPGGQISATGEEVPDCLGDKVNNPRYYYYFDQSPFGKTWRVGKNQAGRKLDGVEYNEFPRWDDLPWD